ncbi:hypothetical protein GCM10010413_48560 [Promicromonospora sukumoe]|uniref:Two-component system sensor histidine kinase DesK n=1 Tax=Promicromonospora sukumoe TaxID=88382 RepID=A0A7W3PF13_9MICO|nr:histidine kinase [Promicromonospora sukumoe]MBA8809458.1 two-component system sensor histidine kinase DesK [Promicromonospora sukumoe]
MTTPQGPTDRPSGTAAARRWYGPLLTVVWVAVLAVPIREAATAASVPLRVVGVAAVVAFAAVFARAFLGYWAGRTPTRRTAALLVGGALACAALIAAAAGQDGLLAVVLLAALVTLLAPTPAAAAGVGALVLVLLVAPRVVPGWQPEDGLALTALLVGVAMYGFRRSRERNRALRQAQEEVAALAVAQERDRISRDMHDILGHSLTVVSVKGELAARLLRSGREDGDPAPTPAAARAEAELTEIRALARSALADMRGMVSGERQVTLAGELAAARLAFDTAGITADLPGAVDEVPEAYRDVFGWALREGTTNVLRHSAARRVVVRLTPDALVVDDDGRGVVPDGAAAPGGGNGLRGLADRAGAAGLVVRTGPSPLGGLRLAVRVPDDEASPDKTVTEREDTA